MTETPTKVITTIVGIIITVLIVSFIFNIWNQQKTSGNKAMAQVEQISANLDEADITQYDGEVVTGSQVLAAIKALEGKEVSIAVCQNTSESAPTAGTPITADTTSKFVYNYTASADALTPITTADRNTAYQAAKSKLTSQYITPSANYTGYVVRSNSTNAILQLVFIRKA